MFNRKKIKFGWMPKSDIFNVYVCTAWHWTTLINYINSGAKPFIKSHSKLYTYVWIDAPFSFSSNLSVLADYVNCKCKQKQNQVACRIWSQCAIVDLLMEFGKWNSPLQCEIWNIIFWVCFCLGLFFLPMAHGIYLD